MVGGQEEKESRSRPRQLRAEYSKWVEWASKAQKYRGVDTVVVTQVKILQVGVIFFGQGESPVRGRGRGRGDGCVGDGHRHVTGLDL